MQWINSWDTHRGTATANGRKKSAAPFHIKKSILASKIQFFLNEEKVHPK